MLGPCSVAPSGAAGCGFPAPQGSRPGLVSAPPFGAQSSAQSNTRHGAYSSADQRAEDRKPLDGDAGVEATGLPRAAAPSPEAPSRNATLFPAARAGGPVSKPPAGSLLRLQHLEPEEESSPVRASRPYRLLCEIVLAALSKIRLWFWQLVAISGHPYIQRWK
jgi:hypothetical protein